MRYQQQVNPIRTGIGIFACGLILLVMELADPGQHVRRVGSSGAGYPLAFYAWLALAGGALTTAYGVGAKMFSKPDDQQ